MVYKLIWKQENCKNLFNQFNISFDHTIHVAQFDEVIKNETKKFKQV